ncbi:protein of unknown function [Candidatus Methylomirabilis oxygeniifera]|uniref:Uncharacterized protein n=1 Tax=Methylomirabilis oxygeniifera TaxID=671143 RepID=D5MFA3_METO1|nr:protein of unknown function [Candidatus Methylomirabilis oxyfera]
MDWGKGLAVDDLPQFLPGFEEWDPLGGNVNRFTALRVPTLPCASLPGAETAEPAELHLSVVLRSKRLRDAFENGINDDFSISFGKVHLGSYQFYQVSLCHDRQLLRLRHDFAYHNGTIHLPEKIVDRER